MATSATIRRSKPQLDWQTVVCPCATLMLDDDGVPLCGVELLGPVEAGRIQLDAIEKSCALLAYRFGRGKREVMLSSDIGIIKGCLETQWVGDHRSWWLELDS